MEAGSVSDIIDIGKDDDDDDDDDDGDYELMIFYVHKNEFNVELTSGKKIKIYVPKQSTVLNV